MNEVHQLMASCSLLLGLITTHHRPTIYSPSSRTALAEAELEYKEDHESRSVYVAFPVLHQGKLERHLSEAGYAGYESLHTAAWTTTAWTLPSNVVSLLIELSKAGLNLFLTDFQTFS